MHNIHRIMKVNLSQTDNYHLPTGGIPLPRSRAGSATASHVK